MIHRAALLSDLQKLLKRLEADLLERSESTEIPEVGAHLRQEFEEATEAHRTAQTFDEWRSDAITQTAAAWVLSCVFVRFLEDNTLIDPPRIAGPGERLQRARDEHELYFRSHPTLNDRDYLIAVFDQLEEFPATGDVFGEHNPIRDIPNWLSGDAAGELLRFFQRIDPNTGALVHDFTDSTWDTRFLGDLYQDLSEVARKRYALLQTPVFVEEFILDRTLDPAIEEFGLAKMGYEARLEPDGRLHPADRFKMIDPACGSGHFVLGSFARLVERWRKKEPGASVSVLLQRALDGVHGVDVNPYAIAIARFRLLLVALKECGISRLSDAPGFEIHLACGDSLLHGSPGGEQQTMGWAPTDHVYQPEDRAALERLLRPKTYHAVVANPPYITPKDSALNAAYRERYATCYRLYSLAVPFLERIVSLAVDGGCTGQITANSFMKREFGKKLIEEFLPRIDLTHVIDTSGAYIPGHGTPTVILFARNRQPIASTLRTVMGIRGEPSTPGDPPRGLVWSAIVEQVDQPGSQSEFVSVDDAPRELFHKHPWSLSGGGASELRRLIENASFATLGDVLADTGFGIVTRLDDVFVVGIATARRRGVPKAQARALVAGENVRDWCIENVNSGIWPFDSRTLAPQGGEALLRFLWTWKTELAERVAYGLTQLQRGLQWFEYSMFFRERVADPRTIATANVATHNHFVFDRNGTLFNVTAPVIKLPANADDDEFIRVLGVLNSSTASFWFKQVFQTKGSSGIGRGVYDEGWEKHYQSDGAKLRMCPIADTADLRTMTLCRKLEACARIRSSLVPDSLFSRNAPTALTIRQAKVDYEKSYDASVALQEELDWHCYVLYNLTEDDRAYASQ